LCRDADWSAGVRHWRLSADTWGPVPEVCGSHSGPVVHKIRGADCFSSFPAPQPLAFGYNPQSV